MCLAFISRSRRFVISMCGGEEFVKPVKHWVERKKHRPLVEMRLRLTQGIAHAILMKSGTRFFFAVTLQFVVKSFEADSQGLRRKPFIAFKTFEGGKNQVTLHIL